MMVDKLEVSIPPSTTKSYGTVKLDCSEHPPMHHKVISGTLPLVQTGPIDNHPIVKYQYFIIIIIRA